MPTQSIGRPPVIRIDIQALRTIAVGLVVLYHLWPQRLTGGFIGVDVFFVISGYLITSHILRDVAKSKFSITKFWAKRVRRLLPASFFVLSVTGIAVYFSTPMSLWGQWLEEIQASALYFENWVLAADSVDYLALGNTSSPTQHFWSLSVEEQFYLAWPLIIASTLFVVGKFSKRFRRRSVFTALLLLTLASFVYGVIQTQAEPAIAYFSTPVRAWEFGVGALLAFAPAVTKQKVAQTLAVTGLAAIIGAGFFFDSTLPFPGSWALIPVLGTALIIWANVNDGFLARVAGLAPIQWVGDRSYSIYLWHWPILILAPFVLNLDASMTSKLIVLGMTLLLAAFTSKFIEKPFLVGGVFGRSNRRKTFTALAIATASLVAVSGAAAAQAERVIANDVLVSTAVEAEACFGAAARAPGQNPCSNPELNRLYPSVISAPSDTSAATKACGSLSRGDSQPGACELVVGTSDVSIALVGDSHANHYAGAFQRLAESRNWSLTVYTKGGCPFTLAQRVQDQVLTAACAKWVANVKAEVIDRKFSLLVTSQWSGVDWAEPAGADEQNYAITGTAKLWRQLTAAGIPVLAIKDSPKHIDDVLGCLANNPNADCSISREDAFDFDAQIGAVNRIDSERVVLVNFDDIYCTETKCLPVIGNAVVYRGENHLTGTFARTLAPYFEPHVLLLLGND